MTIKFGKTEQKKVIKILEEAESFEEASANVLELFQELFAARAKFAVACQLKFNGHYVRELEAEENRAVLGFFPTRKQATDAGAQLSFSNMTHEEMNWYVVPVWHGTPTEFHKDRKESQQQA